METPAAQNVASPLSSCKRWSQSGGIVTHPSLCPKKKRGLRTRRCHSFPARHCETHEMMMRAASTLMLLNVAMVSGQACSNACSFANDGDCDDGRSGAVSSLCPLGSDCADCGAATSIATHCTCDNYNAFLDGVGASTTTGSPVACANAAAGCSFTSRQCIMTSNNGVVTFEHSCVGATATPTPAPAPPPTASTATVETGACDSMPTTSHCCKDGEPDDYVCSATYSCAKGVCLAATYKLCTDDPITLTNYACAATYSCGRGSCVPATYTLCGTSGTKPAQRPTRVAAQAPPRRTPTWSATTI